MKSKTIKNVRQYLSFIILIFSSYLLLACSAELDQAQPVDFIITTSQNATSEAICREGIQATFTTLADQTDYQTEYTSPTLELGADYSVTTSSTFTSQDKVRISVQCFEANGVKGSIVVEGNIAPNHFINIPVNGPGRFNVSFSVLRNETCTQKLINDTRAYQIEILELNEPVPCISGKFNPRPE